MLAYLCWLIHSDFFDEIEYHLLMPGHSHYCVDRDCFAPLGKAKTKIDCFNEHSFWSHFISKTFSF